MREEAHRSHQQFISRGETSLAAREVRVRLRINTRTLLEWYAAFQQAERLLKVMSVM